VVKHQIIYVPGIGDNVGHVQSAALKWWPLYGARGHFHAMPWLGQEPFQPKFERLLTLIDQLNEGGQRISLVGASAGGSAVLNAYLARQDKISGIVLICPKISRPGSVSQATYAQNPAFKESMEQFQGNLAKLTDSDKKRMRVYYSPVDRVVPHADSVIPGVEEICLPRLKHSYAIVFAITFKARHLITFLKQSR
jgi:pimeloyl-ACP methyl ester carboxylesterase